MPPPRVRFNLHNLIDTASALLTPSKPRKKTDNTSGDQAVQLKIFLQSLGSPTNPLAEMLHRFNAEALVNSSFRSALSVTLKTTKTNFMTDFIMMHAKALGSPALVWACLMMWLADIKGLPLDRQGVKPKGCPRFCVNGLMAGNCQSSQRKRNDRKQRTDRPPVGGLQKT